MLHKSTPVVIAACAISLSLVLPGCQTQKEVPEPDFSNAKQVAELATYECYSHNVSENPMDGWFFDLGRREVWYEYDAIVTYGIDANKVEIGKPHQEGKDLVVDVKIPKAQVFGRPAIVDNTISISGERRWYLVFGELTGDQQQEAITSAQDDLEQKASADEAMLEQASDRGRELIENYIMNVGDALGQKYKVEFKTVD